MPDRVIVWAPRSLAGLLSSLVNEFLDFENKHSQCSPGCYTATITMSPIQQTLRMTGLPPAIHRDDIQRHFNAHIGQKGRQTIEAIGPICKEPGENTNQTTVTFSSDEIAQKALRLNYAQRQLSVIGSGAATFSLDREFRGMTTLQSLANPKTNRPDIEWVLLQNLLYTSLPR